MLGPKGVREYWREQTKIGDNPCHYHNKWQDLYAFQVRINTFKRSDFKGFARVVDIGCGTGEYTSALARSSKATFLAYDFPFNIKIAKEQHRDQNNILFKEGAVPSVDLENDLKDADAAIMTTVYPHIAVELREHFFSYLEGMKAGSKIFLLEYLPNVVPEFQKGLKHKHVESFNEVVDKFKSHGWHLEEKREVNFIDSFFFHHIGANILSYLLTLITDFALKFIPIRKSKYKLLIFKK